MLIITDRQKLPILKKICEKFKVPYSVIGRVKEDKMMQVKVETNTIAHLPSKVIANAPLLDRLASKPKYLKNLEGKKKPNTPKDLNLILLRMLANPNIASRIWVYSQYDNEVGIRTVIKPGSDASVLRLDNGKFLSVKIDGNSKHCYINPRQGAIGCFEEACRNVICTGATPIGMVDHLQFGNPEDPEIFWTFKEALEGISEFAKYLNIPCVGGKVSFYNETNDNAIKPTPLIGILGLIDKKLPFIQKIAINDLLVVIGETKDELGGSEYYEYIHDLVGGNCPTVDMRFSKLNQQTVLDLIDKGLVNSVHDCSKGGLGISISELCLTNGIGCIVSLDKIPGQKLRTDEILFSESHSRYLLSVDPKNINKIKSLLGQHNVHFAIIGKFSGTRIIFRNKTKTIANLRIDKAQEKWLNSLGSLITHG
jgi:phosphoribosylformylglycinamidine synthase subunit PurL